MQQKQHDTSFVTRPDFDLHMPKPLSYPLPVAICGGLLALVIFYSLKSHPTLSVLATVFLLFPTIGYVALYISIKRFTNTEARLEARDKFLAQIPWSGDETILDVGCGNGIFILGAAKHLTTGKGVGIDIWTSSSGENRPEAFEKNAKLLGVADKVTLENISVCDLPYDNDYFDIIMSGLTMHHIPRTSKSLAMSEMARVLKPGGTLVIYDVPGTIFQSSRLMRVHDLDVLKKDKNLIFGTKPGSDSSKPMG